MIISLDFPEANKFSNDEWFLDYYELQKLSEACSEKGISVGMEELEQILILLSEWRANVLQRRAD